MKLLTGLLVLAVATFLFCGESMSPHSYSWAYYEHDITLKEYLFALEITTLFMLFYGVLSYVTVCFLMQHNKDWQLRLLISCVLIIDCYWAITTLLLHLKVDVIETSESSTLNEIIPFIGKFAYMIYYIPLILFSLILFLVISLSIINFKLKYRQGKCLLDV